MNYYELQKVFISFALAALMLCSCKNSKPEAAQNADAQSEVTGKADTPETKITAEMAFEGVNNYCHEKFTRMITKVPNLGVEEDDGTIDLHDYLGKEKSAKASSS